MATMQRAFYKMMRDKRRQRMVVVALVALAALLGWAYELSQGRVSLRPASPSAFVAMTQPAPGVHRLHAPIHSRATHATRHRAAAEEEAKAPSLFAQAAELNDLPAALVDPAGGADTLSGGDGGDTGGGLNPGGGPTLFGPSGAFGGASSGGEEPQKRNTPSDDAKTNDPASAVPEPGTWIMMILGIGMVGALQRRQSAKPVAISE